MKQKLISLTIVFSMLCSMLPVFNVTALAEESTSEENAIMISTAAAQIRREYITSLPMQRKL